MPPASQQLLVSALLGDPAVLQYQDAVRRAHCGQTVGDEETGAPPPQPLQGGADLLLGLRVHVRGGLVQDHDVRIGEEAAGKGQQLPLALGEAGAAVSECGIISIRQGGEKGMDTGRLGGGLRSGRG